ncbi:hypothetical protein P2318_09160 [Myxococcaceae bacterium GXIMD 01537]
MRRRRPTPQVLLALLLVGPAALGAPASGDDWLGADKAKHFGATLGLAGLGYGAGALLLESPRARLLSGAALGMGVGLGKELYDLGRGGRFSWKDLTWDAIGTATGLLVSWTLDRLLFHDSAPVRPARRATGAAGGLMGAGSGPRVPCAVWNASC